MGTRFCSKYKCDKCGHTMNQTGISTGDEKPKKSVEQHINEKIAELKARAEKEGMSLKVTVEYEGESTYVYQLGVELHEKCGGHWKKQSTTDLDALHKDLLGY